MAGTSSFGMSGVNAHLIASSVECPRPSDIEMPLDKTRLYALASQFAMCDSVIGTSQRASFVCKPAAARLSWLRQVCTSEPVFSTAAVLECAASAARQSLPRGEVLLSKIVLQLARAYPKSLICEVDLRTGTVIAGSATEPNLLSCSAARPSLEAGTAKPLSPITRLSPHDWSSSIEAGSIGFMEPTVELQREYACHPGLTTAAMHLSLLDTPVAGVLDSLDTVLLGDSHSGGKQLSAIASKQSAALLGLMTVSVAFDGIHATQLTRQAAADKHPMNVLYSVDWMVGDLHTLSPTQTGTRPSTSPKQT